MCDQAGTLSFAFPSPAQPFGFQSACPRPTNLSKPKPHKHALSLMNIYKIRLLFSQTICQPSFFFLILLNAALRLKVLKSCVRSLLINKEQILHINWVWSDSNRLLKLGPQMCVHPTSASHPSLLFSPGTSHEVQVFTCEPSVQSAYPLAAKLFPQSSWCRHQLDL